MGVFGCAVGIDCGLAHGQHPCCFEMLHYTLKIIKIRELCCFAGDSDRGLPGTVYLIVVAPVSCKPGTVSCHINLKISLPKLIS